MSLIATILIVDDDEDIVRLFEQFLELKGHKVVAKLSNGEDAIQYYKKTQNHPDIILMDHRMPLKNGVETTKEILHIKPNSKIIFISADYTIRDLALKAGAVAFLEKPIDFTSLFQIIERIL
ncbi:MAG: response regulator [Candidatus Hermodarchaeota archaeon]